MKMLHSEWEGRLNHGIHTLTKDFYEPLGELEWTYFRTMDQIEPKEAARRSPWLKCGSNGSVCLPIRNVAFSLQY
ncbi:MAG: hypothetical protein K6F63_05555, partial [Lachnospiraceae bacterium]|nr:hypothetical protein [Lachnospiraceae bacterium]